MKLREALKQEKAEMSPLRWKFNYTVLPIYLALVLLPCIPVLILMGIDEEKFLPVLIVWACVFVVLTVAMLCAIPLMTKKETKIELERYGYMFKEPLPLTEENVKINGTLGDDLTYILTKDGVTAEWQEEQQEEGQVFDEMKENLHFVPWKEATFALATQSRLRRVHIAVAVLFEESEDGMEGCAYFLPMTEELFAAIHAFGLQDKLGSDWDYLLYNPEDAFKQILTKGRIITMRNKKTGKLFVNKYGEFIGDEE